MRENKRQKHGDQNLGESTSESLSKTAKKREFGESPCECKQEGQAS